MFERLAANTATVIIGGILLICVIFAARHVLRKMGKGECAGCGGGKKGSCGCGTHIKK